MIFKIHYWLLTAGANAMGILMGVYMEYYTNAAAFEIGLLYMMMPFTGIIFRPILCSMADRKQAHRRYIMTCSIVTGVSYMPFIVLPFLGPQVYEVHQRLCWWVLVALKVTGDVAFGGVLSLGDALAINYAARVNTQFSVYRVWGTISWIVFGVITGHINEIWFLPKYVPALIILCTCNLLDAFIFWLWPAEYFRMVPKEFDAPVVEQTADTKNDKSLPDSTKEAPKFGVFTQSLMPREEVWAHAKGKIKKLLLCNACFSSSKPLSDRQLNYNSNCNAGKLSIQIDSGKTNDFNDDTCDSKEMSCNRTIRNSAYEIDRVTQLKILRLLLRRDPRILLYLMYFVFAGMSIVPLGFFFMSLSARCQETGECHFSQLGGFLQVSMAGVETILFIFIKRIEAALGRVKLISLFSLFMTSKYVFYGTIWPHVNPYFSILAETTYGAAFAVYITLTAEMGHLFANEIKFIIPELLETGIIPPHADTVRVQTSLSATMQSLISIASDGFGRGFGAIIFGIIVDRYSYITLWRVVGISAAIVTVLALVIDLIDRTLNLQLGLDVAAAKRAAEESQSKRLSIASKQQTMNRTDPYPSDNAESQKHN